MVGDTIRASCVGNGNMFERDDGGLYVVLMQSNGIAKNEEVHAMDTGNGQIIRVPNTEFVKYLGRLYDAINIPDDPTDEPTV